MDPNLIIAISTVVYTIFTMILVIMSYRANRLTRKVIANTHRPILIPHLIFEKDNSLSLKLENKSTFASNDIIIKIASPKTTFKINSILPGEFSKSYISDHQNFRQKTTINLKIKYKNEDGYFFKGFLKLDIPPSERSV